jgi:hypothetical protein
MENRFEIKNFLLIENNIVEIENVIFQLLQKLYPNCKMNHTITINPKIQITYTIMLDQTMPSCLIISISSNMNTTTVFFQNMPPKSDIKYSTNTLFDKIKEVIKNTKI